MASSDLRQLWTPTPGGADDTSDCSQMVAAAGAPFSFNISWVDNENNVPDNEWHICTTKVLNTNPKSLYPAGHFTQCGKRKYLWHVSQPLPQLHPGSWGPSHPSPLLLLSKSGDRYRVIRPVEAARLLVCRREEATTEPLASATRALSTKHNTL